jgi:cupin fold WbuC family metalloprotein
MNLTMLNEEVFIASDSIVKIGEEEVVFLKQRASNNQRHRARICAHKADDEALHEMLIAVSKECYVHPHKHVGKSESFHIVDGIVDVVTFNDLGDIVEIIELGDRRSGRNFYYRLPEGAFHTLLVRTEFIVLHEVTTGPFLRERTILADFAPPEEQVAKAGVYISEVAKRVAELTGQSY